MNLSQKGFDFSRPAPYGMRIEKVTECLSRSAILMENVTSSWESKVSRLLAEIVEIGQIASLVGGGGNVSGDGVSFNHYIIVALWI